ncbi:MAG: hypothetical protein HC828_08725 [Blastochloris sp.]|nr:hypothetical protein [Blastochloris sp.]
MSDEKEPNSKVLSRQIKDLSVEINNLKTQRRILEHQYTAEKNREAADKFFRKMPPAVKEHLKSKMAGTSAGE